MNTQTYIIIGIIAVIFVGVLVFLIYKNIKNKRFNSFKKSKKNKASSICKNYALVNLFKYTKNFNFENKGKQYHFDNVIASPFGLILINSSLYRGEIYCEGKNKNWIHFKGDEKEEIKNEQVEIENAIIALRERFAKDKIYNIKLIPAICFADKKIEVFNNDKSVSFFRINELKKFLKNPDFLDKGNNDPKQLIENVLKYKIEV